jgi:hypothetical protein
MPNVSTSLVVLSWIARERCTPKFSSSTEVPMPWKLRFSRFHQTDKKRSFCLLEQVTGTPDQIARIGPQGPMAWQNSKVYTVVHACHWVKNPLDYQSIASALRTPFSWYCFILWNIPYCTCDVVVGDILEKYQYSISMLLFWWEEKVGGKEKGT